MTYLVDDGRIVEVLAKSPIDAVALATIGQPPVPRLVVVIELSSGTRYLYLMGEGNDAIH